MSESRIVSTYTQEKLARLPAQTHLSISVCAIYCHSVAANIDETKNA